MRRIGDRIISLVPAIALLLEQNTFAQAQVSAPTFRWAFQAGGPSDDVANTLRVDSSGNCYVTGNNGSNFQFGTNLLAAGTFAAKFAPNGDLIWVRPSTGIMASGDEAGNCFICGGPEISTAKYDPQGSLIWIRQAGGSSDFAMAVATDASGNCYITGRFISQYCQFGSITLTNRSGGANSDFCVAKYDPDGNVLWAKRGGSPSASASGAWVALDGQGDVFVAGSLPGTGADIDGVALPNLGATTTHVGFLAKFNNAGTFLWAKRITNLFSDYLATDPAGESFLTGQFQFVATFDSFSLTNSGTTGLYVVKYDTDGNALWARQDGMFDMSHGTGVAADAQGNCYLSGTLLGPGFNPATFGGVRLSSDQAIVVAKLDSNGGLVWLKSLDIVRGYNAFPTARVGGVDAVGNTYVVGSFNVTNAFLDSFSLTNASAVNGVSDFFLGAIDRTPPRLGVSTLPGAIVLSWPSNYFDFSLEASPSLISPQPWDSLGAPSIVGTNCVVTDSVTNQTLFYRLRRP
jgi:hypothetical protein